MCTLSLSNLGLKRPSWDAFSRGNDKILGFTCQRNKEIRYFCAKELQKYLLKSRELGNIFQSATVESFSRMQTNNGDYKSSLISREIVSRTSNKWYRAIWCVQLCVFVKERERERAQGNGYAVICITCRYISKIINYNGRHEC